MYIQEVLAMITRSDLVGNPPLERQQYERHYAAAFDACARGAWEAAIAVLEALLVEHPNDIPGQLLLSLAHTEHERRSRVDLILVEIKAGRLEEARGKLESISRSSRQVDAVSGNLLLETLQQVLANAGPRQAE